MWKMYLVNIKNVTLIVLLPKKLCNTAKVVNVGVFLLLLAAVPFLLKRGMAVNACFLPLGPSKRLCHCPPVCGMCVAKFWDQGQAPVPQGQKERRGWSDKSPVMERWDVFLLGIDIKASWCWGSRDCRWRGVFLGDFSKGGYRNAECKGFNFE